LPHVTRLKSYTTAPTLKNGAFVTPRGSRKRTIGASSKNIGMVGAGGGAGGGGGGGGRVPYAVAHPQPVVARVLPYPAPMGPPVMARVVAIQQEGGSWIHPVEQQPQQVPVMAQVVSFGGGYSGYGGQSGQYQQQPPQQQQQQQRQQQQQQQRQQQQRQQQPRQQRQQPGQQRQQRQQPGQQRQRQQQQQQKQQQQEQQQQQQQQQKEPQQQSQKRHGLAHSALAFMKNYHRNDSQGSSFNSKNVFY
jgi:outer membrane biosynthesis protein TonB